MFFLVRVSQVKSRLGRWEQVEGLEGVEYQPASWATSNQALIQKKKAFATTSHHCATCPNIVPAGGGLGCESLQINKS